MGRGGGKFTVSIFEKLIYNHMETILKELYDAPSTLVFEVKAQGVICASGDPQDYVNPFGDEQDF